MPERGHKEVRRGGSLLSAGADLLNIFGLFLFFVLGLDFQIFVVILEELFFSVVAGLGGQPPRLSSRKTPHTHTHAKPLDSPGG